MERTPDDKGLNAYFRKGVTAVRDFLYGFFLHGMVREVAGRKRRKESVFFVYVMGDFVGLPIFPNYYRLRLLPYCFAKLGPWKRTILRPKDVLSAVED